MKFSLLLGLALSAWLTPLSAAPIKIFNTGANGSGVDPNYQVTSSTDPSLTSPAPVLSVAHPNYAWAAPLPGSSWINPSGNGTLYYCSGCYYSFTTTFDLTGFNPLSAVLSGKVLADDTFALNLNGSWVSPWTYGYSQATDFTIGSQYSSLFKNGVNTLSFVVENYYGPMGLDATVSGTADASTVPEPGAAGLFAIAGLLLGTVGFIRRRSRTAPADHA